MPKVTIGTTVVDVPVGTRLVNVIEDAGIMIGHRCGGKSRCTTCRVQFVAGEPASMNAAETAFSEFRNRESTIDVPGEIKALLDQGVAIEKERMMAEIKKSEMMQRYQPSHPYVKAINSQIKQLKAENNALEKQINSLPQTQQEYLSYARDAEISTKL